MNKWMLIGSAALLLSGCSTDPMTPSALSADLTRHYQGSPVNEFFYNNGQPIAEWHANDGTRTYKWASLPQDNRVQARYYSPDGEFLIADTYSNETLNNYCEVRILTDGQDVIQKVIVAIDTVGKISPSRCSELLD